MPRESGGSWKDGVKPDDLPPSEAGGRRPITIQVRRCSLTSRADRMRLQASGLGDGRSHDRGSGQRKRELTIDY